MKQTLSERQIIQLAQQEDALLQNKRTYLGNLENALIDVLKSIASLKEIEKKPGKILVRLGPGVLVEAEINETENCKRTFSENGFRDAKIKDTIVWLEEKHKNLEEQVKKVSIDVAKSEANLGQLSALLNQIEMEKRKNISVK